MTIIGDHVIFFLNIITAYDYNFSLSSMLSGLGMFGRAKKVTFAIREFHTIIDRRVQLKDKVEHHRHHHHPSHHHHHFGH